MGVGGWSLRTTQGREALYAPRSDMAGAGSTSG